MYRKYKKEEFYTLKAREEGYPARSVYKLQEIDEKYKIFQKGDRVLDLGCAPGSWLKYISEKIGENGRVVGIDNTDLKIKLEKNAVFIKKNILDSDIIASKELQKKFQAVVADLAPRTSGIKSADSINSSLLADQALTFAKLVLLPRGDFVCKVLEGELTDKFFKETAQNFKFAKRFRPRAVSKESREIYIIGKGYKV
jgi:23S rRNA (uridine2552-2'-O)-methyltransferase